jgi:hypothetical protein
MNIRDNLARESIDAIPGTAYHTASSSPGGNKKMAKKGRLRNAAVKIGAAVGKADRTAHKVVRAGALAKKELEQISKQIDGLKRQLKKSTNRLRKALA